MITRSYKALTSRPIFVLAAALAILMLAAPFAFAATEKFTVPENTTEPVARFSASDEDGDEITWGLEGDDEGVFKISDAGVLTFKEKPNYEDAADKDKDNVYEVIVTATAKTKSTQDVEVTVTDDDEPGKVTLSQPQPQVSRDLEATGPGDPDAPVEDEKWQWSRGPNIDGPWTEIAKATALSRPPVEADIGSYLQATVTYTDKFDSGKTASFVSENPVEERTVANAAPSFSDHDTDDTTGAVEATRAVDEGVKGANVGKPLSAKDSDGDVLLYTIAPDGSMNDTAVTNIKDLFSIDTRSGQLKTKDDTLNSDDDGDDATNETYTITVTAKDPSGAPGMATVTVTITDVNDKPAFPDTSLEAHEIAEDATILTLGAAAYAATDDDAGDGENGVQLTYGVTGADADSFTIGNGEDLNDDGDAVDDNEALGRLALKETPNFETKSSYSVTVTATDDDNATAELKVTVTVTNAEDDGVVSLTHREPQVDRQVVASLSDEDGSVSGADWQWYRNAVEGTATAVEATFADAPECTDTTGAEILCSIPKATGPAYTPVVADTAGDGDTAARLAARVTYTDKHESDPDSDSAIALTQADVQVSDPANTAPKFAADQDPNTAGDQADAVRSVPENEKGESVGDAVTATDADGDLMIYTLSGADEMYFTIVSGLKDGGSGEGQIKTAMELDHEAKDMYMIVVTATDPSGATDTVNVMIMVTDEDDPPTITADNTFTVPENTNTTDAVVSFSASDEDGDEVTWGLEGDDAGDFEISDAGVLTFKEKPDYEGAADKDEDNIYKVTVTATGETKNTQAIEVTVTDLDEPGEVTLSQPQPQVGRTITAEGSNDPDAGVEDEKWQWSRGPSMDGPWADIAKATSTSRTPDAADDGMYLQATVTYTDKFGAQSASMVSENPVEERTLANAAPSFSDHDTNDDTEGVQATRAVDEGAKGANVGKPLSAKDSDGDVLLYTIAATGTLEAGGNNDLTSGDVTNIRDLFSIDPRSGQLKTKVDTLDSDDSGTTADSTPADDAEVTYTFVVTAKDASGAPGTATVTVTITDVNDKPAFPDTSADAIPVAEGAVETALQLATYAATDADAGDGDDVTGAELTYGVTGADADSFTIGNGGASPDFTRGQLRLKDSPNFEDQSSYSVTVTATDDDNATAELKVTVTVTNTEDDGEVDLSQREPQVDRMVVASLSDEDGNISGAKWQWYRNATDTAPDDNALDTADDAAVCADDTDTAALCRIDKATGPSYTPVMADTAGDGDTAARLAVRVTYTDKHVTDIGDDGDDGDSAIAVTEADVQVSDPANTAPKFAADQDPNTAGNQADAMRSVVENEKGMAVGDAVTATDADGDLLVYSLGGPDAASFTIDSGLKADDSEGQIKTAVKLDYEMKAMYMVVVTATDPSGASDSINVMISVTDADDPPVVERTMAPEFDEGDTTSRIVDENTAAGMAIGDAITATDENTGDSVTYSLDEMGDMYFDIDSATGQLMTEADLDHETRDSYSVTVTATDAVDLYDMITVTITVSDVNEAPTFDAHTVEPVMLDVAENTAAGENIGDPVVAMDEDEGDTLTYALGGDDAASFAIDPATGQLMTMAALDYETKSSYSVTVMATDSDGLYDMIAVTITVTNVNDQMPMFADDMAEFSVAENAAAGTEVGMVMATADDDDSLMYSGDSMYFDVDPETGQIVVAEGAMLDYEMEDMHMVTVTASDGESSDSIMVTITVTDMYPGCGTQGGDAANMYLNNDCEALLDAKDALGGSLNWSEDMAIADWDGVQGHPMFPSRAGDPMRVTALHLQNMELDGEIPAAIGRLDALMYLNVHSNGLSGDLSALGGLENLVRIYANNNVLDALGDLSGATSLEILWAHQNEDEDMVGTLMGPLMADYLPASLTWISLYGTALGGAIPDLSALTSLERLYLDRANLSGEIPASLGSVTSLTHLRLKYNGLSGEIPMELNNLTNLEWVRINHAGDFTGCVPEALTDAGAGNSDAEHLGLPTCE